MDGGRLLKPEVALYSTDGNEWIIEGHGVDPDIYVDNDPAKEYVGIDEQLNKAIEVILDELKTKGGISPLLPTRKKINRPKRKMAKRRYFFQTGIRPGVEGALISSIFFSRFSSPSPPAS